MKDLFKDEHGEVGALVEIAIGLTILMIVLGYIFAPVGLDAFDNVDRANISSIVSGSTGGNIWDAIIPVSLAVVILALVMVIKKAGQ